MNAQFTRLAITDATDVVILSNIAEGVDGATYFIQTREPRNPLIVEDGQLEHNGITVSIDMRAIRGSAEATLLTTWTASGVKLQWSALTLDGTWVTVPAAMKLVKNEQLDDTHVVAVMASIETTGEGYTMPTGFKREHLGANILATNNGEAKSGDLWYGWTVVNATAQTVGASSLQFVLTGATGYAQSNLAFFPFAGERLTASIKINTISDGDWASELCFFEVDGTFISKISVAGYTIADNGTRTTNATGGIVPADTAFVAMRFAGSTATIGDVANLSFPIIRRGTSDVYTRF